MKNVTKEELILREYVKLFNDDFIQSINFGFIKENEIEELELGFSPDLITKANVKKAYGLALIYSLGLNRKKDLAKAKSYFAYVYESEEPLYLIMAAVDYKEKFHDEKEYLRFVERAKEVVGEETTNFILNIFNDFED